MKLLVKGLGQVAFAIAGGTIEATSSTSLKELSRGPTFSTYVQKSYFDLAGLTQQEKTLFFETVSVQQAYNPSIGGGHTGDGLWEQIVLTTSPIAEDNLSLEFALGAGLPGSTIDWSQLVYYRSRTFTQTTDMAGFAFLPTNSQNNMGSAFPTASDRVYIYRFMQASCLAPTAQFNSILLPGCQIVLGATAKEEPDFQYLYRLMRSYELQNEPDED